MRAGEGGATPVVPMRCLTVDSDSLSPLLQTASSDNVTTVVIALAANVLVAFAKSVAAVLTVSRGSRAT